MGVLPSVSDCCQTCDEQVPVQIPGSTGAAGTNGADGADGVDAFTHLTSGFTMPAVSGNVVVAVANSSWMAAGQKIFIAGAGYFNFVSSTSSTNATLTNLGYTGNAAPAASIATMGIVSPGGVKGTDGADGNPANIPLTTKGDILTRDVTSEVRVGIGANGTRLVADSAQASGMRYDKVDLSLAAEVKNALPIANGGTGQTTANPAFNALSPVTTRGDLIVRNGTVNARLPLGAQYTVVKSDGTDVTYGLVAKDNLDTQVGRAATDPAMYREELASATDGGTFTSGAWQTRPLNVETYDPAAIGALAANQITLAAGTYRFRGQAVGYQCDNHQTRLQNITAGTTIAFGTTVRSGAAEEAICSSEVQGRVTFAGATVVELQHRCETTKATSGFGKASSFSNVEVFAWIEFVKEAK